MTADRWEPRPLPHVTPETERFWAAATDGQFLLKRCTECDLTYYYPRAHCPDCLSADTEWIEAAGTGEVYAVTETDIISNWPEEHLPLVAAYVELTDGPRLFTTLIECSREDVEIGTSVEVAFIDTDRDDVAIPVFKPRE